MSTPSTLYGRDDALEGLRAAFEAARGGRGQLWLISGEAGIGKSALLAAFAEQIAAEAAVTWGRAWEFADAPAYFPLWPCLRSLGVAADARETGGDEEQAFQLWESVLSALARAASATPQVWLVEDLHAADLGTLDLLTYLVQPLRALRALIVATMRPEDPRLGERQARRSSRMARDGHALTLGPLGERDVAMLAEQTLGSAPSEAALARLCALTGGNPLFVVECVRAAQRSGGLEAGGAAIPPTVRQVVLERVSLLPDATRDALACGAVLGRDVLTASVARMTDSTPLRVADVLLPAVRAGILRETKPGQLTFHHALICDAIYEALSPAERARLHRRAEIALAALGDAPEVVVERARHALAAAPGGDGDHALRSARQALEVLEREGAVDRAFALHERIAEARRAGLLPQATHHELLDAARIAQQAGYARTARRICEQILSATRGSDPATFARAALLHAADVRVGVIDPWQIAVLEEAFAAVGDGAPELSCRVLARWSTALQPADDHTVPTEMAQRALAEARATGDPATILDVLDLAGLGAYCAPLAERMAWAEELRERALMAGDARKALTAWTWFVFWHAEAGDFVSLERAVSSALALSGRMGHPRFRWEPLLMASGQALAAGRFDDADRFSTEVAQIAALIDDPRLTLSCVAHEIFRARLCGDARALERGLDELDGVADGIKRKDEFVQVVRAGCWAFAGDRAAARAALDRIDLASATLELDPMPLSLIGEACALAGDDDERRHALARIGALGIDDIYTAGIAYTYEGTVGRVAALLQAALGDRAAAATQLEAALAKARARGHLPWVARIERDLAGVRRRGAAAPKISAAPASEASAPVALSRTGDVWTVRRGSAVARVKNSRGMQLLARLVERPEEEIHVLALASDQGMALPETSAGDVLDAQARAAYRKRLADIERALAAAETKRRASEMVQLSLERQALIDELSRATGLGGRMRKAGSATERARVNVQRSLKAAIARIAAVDADLGGYLERAIRTGTYCCFRP